MLPSSISHKISGLRLWERALQVFWGVARWLTLVLAALLVACLVDWLIDRNQETPWTLRRFLLLAQVFIAATAAGYFIVWPLTRRLSDSLLALWVEDRHPQLEHRLISAIQLNQPGADLAGMSPELVGLVTKEAAERTQRIAFTKVADNRRLGWSIGLLLPVAVIAALPFILNPEMADALLARQLLQDVEVPRSIYIENATREVWPSGEKVTLRFRVSGKIDEATAKQSVGEVTVQPTGLPRDRYPMKFVKWRGDAADFTTEVPATSTNFTFWARLEDGRLRQPQHVRFVPRPIIVKQDAWLLLPTYCGTRSDGKPYEKAQPRGDIAGIPGSSARVEIETQRPIENAKIELLAPKFGGDSAKDTFDEVVFRTLDMTVSADGRKAEGVFPLQAEALSYRLVVTDEHGFTNVPPPRRLLRIVPEDAPQVFLLREQFPPAGGLLVEGPTEDYVVDGVPALIGGPIRIAYACEGPYGIGEVRLHYRVLKKAESGNEDIKQDDFQFLKMKRVTPAADVGPFDPNRGVFEKTGQFDQVEWFDEPKFPALSPAQEDPAQKGGGRYDLKTKGLINSQGELLKLKDGDQIEYCVKVFAGAAGDGRPFAQSETRVTNVVGFEEFARWIRDTIQEEQRLRSLESGQRNVFDQKQ